MYAVKRLRYPAYTWFTLQQISGRLLAFAKSALGVRRDKAALFPVGANPARQPLQPEATGAVMEVTKWLKPLV